jgi:NAD(P)-dependent dehydrogenase (short-subunit alcohol dehydrogenase family)
MMTPVTFRFDDQTVLVTGGATSLGFAIAEVFAAGARIALNDLSAGYIDVEEGGQHLDEAYKTAARSAIPLGRSEAPADVARVILLLASPLAGYVRGAVVAVDGGSGAGRLALRPSGP